MTVKCFERNHKEQSLVKVKTMVEGATLLSSDWTIVAL